jgi:hypothetical protein
MKCLHINVAINVILTSKKKKKKTVCHLRVMAKVVSLDILKKIIIFFFRNLFICLIVIGVTYFLNIGLIITTYHLNNCKKKKLNFFWH